MDKSTQTADSQADRSNPTSGMAQPGGNYATPTDVHGDDHKKKDERHPKIVFLKKE